MKIRQYAGGVFAVVLVSLGAAAVPSADTVAYTQYDAAAFKVYPEMLYAEYWIERTTGADEVLIPAELLADYNQYNLRNAECLADFANYPEGLTKLELRAFISKLSEVNNSTLQWPTKNFRSADGELLTDEDYRKFAENLNLSGIKDYNPVRWGMVVKRELLRRFPTFAEVRNSGMNPEVNMFVESGAFPGETVAILHESTDGKWLFVQKYDYQAWIPAEAVAMGAKPQIMEYLNSDEFLVVTGAQIRTAVNPWNADLSERVYDMGAKLPLMKSWPEMVDKRVPFGTFVVALPVRAADGKLEILPGLIPRSTDVSVGYLPYTKENIIRQGFKFIGERYGWGDMNNGRDCSGIVRNIYMSMGVMMARNGTEQTLQMAGKFWDFSDLNLEQKAERLNELECGDVIRFSGHTAMYLGRYSGEHYMLHDTTGIEFVWRNNAVEVGFKGAGVTPMLMLTSNNGKNAYLDSMQNARRLRF